MGLAEFAGTKLLGPIDPDALKARSRKQGRGGACAWPMPGRGDEAFFAALFEQISQTSDLGFGLVAGDDVGVAAAPDLLLPAVEASDLSGDLGIDVAHETGELLDASGPEEEMAVVRQVDQTADPHVVALLEASQSPDDDRVEPWTWPQEESPMDHPAGDLDQVVVGG